MQDYVSLCLDARWAPLVSLSIGVAAIALAGALVCRLIETATWQRVIWQAAVLGLLVLVLVEGTGVRSAATRLGVALTAMGEAYRSDEAQADPGVASFGASPSGTENAVGAGASVTVSQPAQNAGQPTDDGFAAAFVAQSLSKWIDGPSGVIRDDVSDEGLGGVVAEASRDGAMAAAAKTPVAPTKPSDLGGGYAGLVWWTGIAWMIGTLLVMGRMVVGRVMLGVFGRRATPGRKDLRERVAALGVHFGMRRPVRVIEAKGLSAPVAFGTWRPTIAVPATFSEDFDSRQQEAVLAHELAHLAAGDPLWQSLGDCACATLWWHPLAWWTRGRLRAASEAAADEASLLVPDGPSLLAGCLVSLARRLTGSPRLGWLPVQGHGFRSSLGRRVERLLRLSPRAWRAPRRRWMASVRAAMIVMMVFVSVFSTAWAHSQAHFAEGETTMSMLRRAWRQSLAATTLAWFVSTSAVSVAGDEPSPKPVQPAAAERDKAAPDQVAQAERREGEGRERAEAEKREREQVELATHAQELKEEHRKLQEKAGDIERRLKELPDSAEQDAKELQGALKEIRERSGQIEEKLAAIARELKGSQDRMRPEAAPESQRKARVQEAMAQLRRLQAELTERSRAVKRELEGVAEGRQAVRQKLEAELRQIEAKLQAVKREAGDRGADRVGSGFMDGEGAGPARMRIQRRLEEIDREVRRLKDEGKLEAAESLTREGRELKERLRQLRDMPDRDREGGQPGEPAREDVDKRMQHLKAAIDNLHAAGLHEAADGLAREGDRLVRKGGGMLRPDGDVPWERRGPQPMIKRFEGMPPDILYRTSPEVQNLRGEVQELRREMNEIRDLLKELKQREERTRY